MSKTNKDFLLRSMFFVPGHIEKFFKKAIQSDADALILDMEDSVPENKKDEVRQILTNRLKTCKLSMPVFVRINSRESGLMKKDLEATVSPNVEGFIFPKVRNAADIVYMEKMLAALETQNKIVSGKFSILPLIETAEAVMEIMNIAKSSERILGLVFGHEDFLLDMRAVHSDNMNNLLVPRMMISMAAHAAGCQAIDTPYLDIKNVDGCAKFVKESQELGFSGMLVLHPLQLQVANEGYSPSQDDIKQAEKILAIDEEAKMNGRSIAFSDGKFTAPPILKQAKLIIERASKIKLTGADKNEKQ